MISAFGKGSVKVRFTGIVISTFYEPKEGGMTGWVTECCASKKNNFRSPLWARRMLQLQRWAIVEKNPQASSNEYGYYRGPSEVRKGICSIL